jgi:hypothetical protein
LLPKTVLTTLLKKDIIFALKNDIFFNNNIKKKFDPWKTKKIGTADNNSVNSTDDFQRTAFK